MVNIDIVEQLKELTKDIDFLNEEIANSVSGILRESGEIVAESQRKIIRTRSKVLPNLISPWLHVDEKGVAILEVGYGTEEIREAPQSVIMEYGRPGKIVGKPYTMRKSRKGNWTWHRMKVGKIEPTPHIRKGFDDAQETVLKKMVDGLGEVLDKKW